MLYEITGRRYTLYTLPGALPPNKTILGVDSFVAFLYNANRLKISVGNVTCGV
jgi:hypothetical protein